MTDEESFLAHLVLAPDDRVTRTVYADWIDDHTDRHHEATVLRSELEPERVTALVSPPRECAVEVGPDRHTPTIITIARIEVPPLLRCVVRLKFNRPVILDHFTSTTDEFVKDLTSVIVKRAGSDIWLFSFVIAPGLARQDPVGNSFVFLPEAPIEFWMSSKKRAIVHLTMTFVAYPT